MPGKWKVTAGGATAQQKADRLRSRADKLGRHAMAWESGAEREPAIAKRLADLPAGFTVLHDLRLPGTETRLDHLVVSSGGLYLVDAKKYSGHLVYSKKMLWHGRFPIVDKLETLVWEAETLSEVIGREVVPVMCFVDAVLPQPVATLGTVIVCRASVLHTVVRSTHATMSAGELARVLDVAVQLAAPRRPGADLLESVPGLRAARPVVEPTTDAADAQPSLPPPPTQQPPVPLDATQLNIAPDAELSDDEFWNGPEAAARAAAKAAGEATGQIAAVTTTGQTPAISTTPPISAPGGRPVREPRDRQWPRRVIVAVVGMALAAAAIVIVWKVSQTTEKNRIETEKVLASTTTTTAKSTKSTDETGAVTEDPDETVAAVTTTTTLDLTKAGFSATCPTPGAGWSLRPVWPGDQDNLAWYDFSFQLFDASFQQFATMTAPTFTQYTPTAVPSGNARTIRIQAVYTDGHVGEPVVTQWTAPDDGC